MAEVSKSSSYEQNSIERVSGYFWGLFVFFFEAVFYLLAGLVGSILIEWFGMIFIWEDQGAQHAANMLAIESSYIELDFSREVLGVSPLALVNDAVFQTGEALRVDGGWRQSVIDLSTAPIYRTDGHIIEYTKIVMRYSRPYLSAANDIIIVYVLRMVIVFLSIPLIILTAFIWAIDGLCERELRKEGAGRESTTKYHFVQKYLSIFLLAPFIFYLASPVATHPNWVLAPISMAVGFLSYFAASNFKKYL